MERSDWSDFFAVLVVVSILMCLVVVCQWDSNPGKNSQPQCPTPRPVIFS